MTGCVALRKDVYYVRLSYYDKDHIRKDKFVSTRLLGRGAKQKATAMIDSLIEKYSYLEKQFSHFLARNDIRHLKFHCLRHTSATILLSNGCDIKTVSARLGHSSIDTTNIYVHVLESVDRQAATTFENLCN